MIESMSACVVGMNVQVYAVDTVTPFYQIEIIYRIAKGIYMHMSSSIRNLK